VSFETLLWVRTQQTGNVASRSVLRVLADHAGQDHSCYLRTRLIAAETDLSEAGVRKALTRLIDAGLVRVYERYHPNGARRSNRYQLLPDGADTPPPDHEDWADVRQAPPSEVEAPLQPGAGTPPQQGEGFPTPEASRSETPPVKGRAPRSTATRVPDDFAPTDEMKAWFAAEKLHEVIHGKTEHDKFMDYWRALPGVKGRKLDWPATWRNWMRTAAERAGRVGYARPVSGPPGTSLVPSSGASYNTASTTNNKILQTLAIAEKFRQQEESQ
jgi:hypothetical protein